MRRCMPAYRWLYGRWRLDSAHQVADAPVFEEYLNSPHDTAPADLITDIFLPLSVCRGCAALWVGARSTKFRGGFLGYLNSSFWALFERWIVENQSMP